VKKLSEDIIKFFHNQGFVIVSTIDQHGTPHNSCKGIVKISRSGYIYLLDLYRARTYDNLKRDPRISITSVDEHKFRGYCLKGKAKVILAENLKSKIITEWENRITKRISRRLIRNIHGESGHTRHPEALLPRPEYLIVMQVTDIVDLTPHNLK
jgi:uncharacterized pyridoxamine 5'-phosphate oxidase family protein